MATVGLISCVSRKLGYSTQARDLYDSALFKKSRQYIERNCDNWFILSAKYGLIQPEMTVAPYNETLNVKSKSEKKLWSIEVWNSLKEKLTPGDKVIILAGINYRYFLVPMIEGYGCTVEIPMEGKSIGNQLKWLSEQVKVPCYEFDLERLYSCLRRLETGVGGKRILSECNGYQKWPNSGIYFFFEPGEYRSSGKELRVVRVGTHGISRGSRSTLWNRLRTHRGTNSGYGNHRSSVFRLHVGAAIAAKESLMAVPTWGMGQNANAVIRKEEARLEQVVSSFIGKMSLLWIAVDDSAGPSSDRAYLERNLIGLLSNLTKPVDPPSADWVGLFSPNVLIRKSGLWNLDFTAYQYSPEFFKVMDDYVEVTLGKKAPPGKSIAPRYWYLNQRIGSSSNQLTLFGDNL